MRFDLVYWLGVVKFDFFRDFVVLICFCVLCCKIKLLSFVKVCMNCTCNYMVRAIMRSRNAEDTSRQDALIHIVIGANMVDLQNLWYWWDKRSVIFCAKFTCYSVSFARLNYDCLPHHGICLHWVLRAHHKHNVVEILISPWKWCTTTHEKLSRIAVVTDSELQIVHKFIIPEVTIINLNKWILNMFTLLSKSCQS